jgi:hypothetical protein
MVLFSVIAVGIVRAPDTRLPNILEGLPVFCKQGSISGRCLVPPKYDIAIGGVRFSRQSFDPLRQFAGDVTHLEDGRLG